MKQLPETLSLKLRELTAEPGVYLLKDQRGRVIYVGKAKQLRARVRSYFTGGSDERRLLPFLKARIADFDVLEVATEKEALLLENTLIKQHRPRYNVRLVDDKTFLSLRLDRRHPFPRFTTMRRRRADGARYFGPYSSARAIRATLKLVYRTFGIRSCSDSMFANRTRPCLYYQIGQCLAPCVGYVTEAGYRDALAEAEMLLDGRDRELLQRLESAMHAASEDERYEEAARYRDRARAVQRSVEKQSVSLSGGGEFDVVGHAGSGTGHAFVWLMVRDGRVVDSTTVRVEDRGRKSRAELFSAVLIRAYEERPVPPLILCPIEPADPAAVVQILSERRGSVVEIAIPRRGARRRLLMMAEGNATSQARLLSRPDEGPAAELLHPLTDALDLTRLPRRIECFDISHLGGSLTVGAMSVFEDGLPKTAAYRRYRVRSQVAGDDYASLREVLSRRISRGLDDGDLPDLLMIDGGPGQLAIGLGVREELGATDLELLAFAKGVDRDAGRELIHRPGREPLKLAGDDPALHLLQRVRDEAHRFAGSYQRKLRTQRDRGSKLDQIPGVGPALKRALLRHFGSLRAVTDASEHDLAQVAGIGPRLAAKIARALSSGPAEESRRDSSEA